MRRHRVPRAAAALRVRVLVRASPAQRLLSERRHRGEETAQRPADHALYDAERPRCAPGHGTGCVVWPRRRRRRPRRLESMVEGVATLCRKHFSGWCQKVTCFQSVLIKKLAVLESGSLKSIAML